MPKKSQNRIQRRSLLASMGGLITLWSQSMNTTAHAATPAAIPLSAKGGFEVKIGPPEALSSPADGAALFKRSLNKHYSGELLGGAIGEMQMAGQPQLGEAAYTALESFVGELQGRKGSFALAHLGLMSGGKQDLRICIVPGSGLGELVGISGELILRIEAGVHFYELNYRLN
jgi:hypothetical protein